MTQSLYRRSRWPTQPTDPVHQWLRWLPPAHDAERMELSGSVHQLVRGVLPAHDALRMAPRWGTESDFMV